MSGLKKANRRDSSQSQLNMAVYQEKCIQTAQQKLLDTHKEAHSVWSLYSESESNPVVQHLLTQINSIHQLWIRANEDFVQQYASYRNYFLEVLKGERALGEMEKTVEDYAPKINKLQKQLDSVMAKGKDKKSEAVTLELGKYLSLQQKAEKDLLTGRENHELFKLRSIRNAVKLVTDCQITLHERCHEMFQTQRLILDYYTASTYSSSSSVHLTEAEANSQTLLVDLKRKLQLDGPDPGTASSELEPSQAILDEVVHNRLADVFGGPPLMDNLQIDPDDQATYNPIPDLEPHLHLQPRKGSKGADRPLPAVPTTDQPTKPLVPSAPSRAGSVLPPVPPRKDLLRSKSARDEEDPEYLDMQSDYSLRVNSVYQSDPEQDAYYLLAKTKSGSNNNSIKSQGSSGSRNDSGLESRGSTKSESSLQEEVYEVVDPQFYRRSATKTEDVYEL